MVPYRDAAGPLRHPRKAVVTARLAIVSSQNYRIDETSAAKSVYDRCAPAVSGDAGGRAARNGGCRSASTAADYGSAADPPRGAFAARRIPARNRGGQSSRDPIAVAADAADRRSRFRRAVVVRRRRGRFGGAAADTRVAPPPAADAARHALGRPARRGAALARTSRHTRREPRAAPRQGCDRGGELRKDRRFGPGGTGGALARRPSFSRNPSAALAADPSRGR